MSAHALVVERSRARAAEVASCAHAHGPRAAERVARYAQRDRSLAVVGEFMPFVHTTHAGYARRRARRRVGLAFALASLLVALSACGISDNTDRHLTLLTLSAENAPSFEYTNFVADGNYTDCTAFGRLSFEGQRADGVGTPPRLVVEAGIPDDELFERDVPLAVPEDTSARVSTDDEVWEGLTGEVIVRRFMNGLDLDLRIEVDLTRPLTDDAAPSRVRGLIVCQEFLLGGADGDKPPYEGGDGDGVDVDFD